MKIIKVLFAVLFLCGILLTDLSAETVMLDRIVAVVNDEIITLAELEKFKDILYMGAEQKPSDPQANLQLINQMVEKRLMLQEAKVLEVKVTEAQLQSAIKDVVQKSNASLDDFKKIVKQNGITLRSTAIF